MHDHGFMIQALIYFAAAVLLVPLFTRLKLGAVLGYLVAGVLIGPWAFKLISDPKAVESVSELGVVLLMFLVGLELNPKRLWSLRKAIFGMGGLQVVATSILVALAAWFVLSMPGFGPALAIGMAVTMSSTAIALQVLEEKHLMATQGGQAAVAVSLFQDLAVIPMLLVLGLLAPVASGAGVSSVPAFGWINLLEAIALIAAMVLIGRLVLRPVFRLIASTGLREVFIAFALVLIVGSGLLTQWVGLSLALGAFVAGILLAESEYRMELEVDIEPFKGLLLGLFFMAVGMGIDFGLLLKSPWLVLALAVAAVALKTFLLLLVAWSFKLCKQDAWMFALSLSQVGEFAFVMSGTAQKSSLLSAEQAAILNGVVALSMLFTPILFLLYERFIAARYNSNQKRSPDSIEEKNLVIIAGMGRFGQITARMLQARGFELTLIDIDPNHIEDMRRFGWRTYYGDASRPDVLEAAGIHDAKLIVLAMDDAEAVQATSEYVRRHHADVKVLARARSRTESVALRKMGVQEIRETFGSALLMAQESLIHLGLSPYAARKIALQFRDHDERLLSEQMLIEDQDEEKRIALSHKSRQDLAKLLTREQAERNQGNNPIADDQNWKPNAT